MEAQVFVSQSKMSEIVKDYLEHYKFCFSITEYDVLSVFVIHMSEAELLQMDSYTSSIMNSIGVHL